MRPNPRAHRVAPNMCVLKVYRHGDRMPRGVRGQGLGVGVRVPDVAERADRRSLARVRHIGVDVVCVCPGRAWRQTPLDSLAPPVVVVLASSPPLRSSPVLALCMPAFQCPLPIVLDAGLGRDSSEKRAAAMLRAKGISDSGGSRMRCCSVRWTCCVALHGWPPLRFSQLGSMSSPCGVR